MISRKLDFLNTELQGAQSVSNRCTKKDTRIDTGVQTNRFTV